MQNKVLIPILAIIGGVVLLALGCYLGIVIQIQKTPKPLDLLLLDKILSITASGLITNISERTITLTQAEESLTIPIREDAKIVAYVTPETEGAPLERKEINLEDIEVGNYLSVSIKILPEGQLEGVDVTVLPVVFIPR